MLIADVEFKEVDPPEDFWCECGHTAPKLFKRAGPDSKSELIRFWHIKGAGHSKIICEPCLVIINYKVRMKKKINKLRERYG